MRQRPHGFDAKLKLGLYLIEARGLCRRGEWTHFLNSQGLKLRVAEECMHFAKYQDLLEANAHDRSPWTTEEARKLISSHRKAIGKGRQRRPASRLNPGSIRQRDQEVDTGNQGRADQPRSNTSDAANREPVATHSDSPSAEVPDSATPATPHQTAARNRCADDVADADERAATTMVGQQRVSAPPEPSDEEWLALIPLRLDLADTSNFDRDALLWRRTRSLALQVCELINPTPDEVGRSTYFKMARNRYRLRLLFGLRVNHPQLWRICPQCRGQFTDRPGTMTCSGCEGAGFLLTHEGEPVEEGEAG